MAGEDSASYALRIKFGEWFEIGVSQRALNSLLAEFDKFLAWVHKNPRQFYAILALLAVWVVVRGWRSADIRRMKREYGDELK